MTKALDFTYMATHVFCSAPYINQMNYLNWKNKAESLKWKNWKHQGLLDLIQLSRVCPTYNQNMLLVELHFWEGSTNTFQHCYRMLTPTLFDVVAITSVQPTGEVFDPFVDTKNIIQFNLKRASLTNFIADHYDEPTIEVSNKEHVAFLSLWLTHFIFCSSSLQVAKSFVILANQLHIGKNLSLNQLMFLSIKGSRLALLTPVDKGFSTPESST